MPRHKRPDAGTRTKFAIICSQHQKKLLESAAERVGCDLSTITLSYALRGIGALGVVDGEPTDLPVIVNGSIGARLRERASSQGVAPDRMLELLLTAAEV